MKRMAMVCLVVMLQCVSVIADPNGKNLAEITEEWSPHGFLSTTWQQQYIGLRVSGVFYKESMLWTELYLNLPNNFFMDLWWSADLQDSDLSSTGGDEFDTTFGWQTKFFGLDAMVSVSQFTCLPSKGFLGEGHAWSPDLILSKSFKINEKHTVTPAFWIGYLSFNDDFWKGALYTLPNIRHDWKEPFGIEKLTFSHTVMFPWDDGFIANSSDGLFFRWMPAFNWQLSKHLTLTAPGVIIVEPITDPHDGRGDEISLNFSLAYHF